MILYFDIFETLRIYHPAIYTSNVSTPATTAEDSAHGGGADVGGGNINAWVCFEFKVGKASED